MRYVIRRARRGYEGTFSNIKWGTVATQNLNISRGAFDVYLYLRRFVSGAVMDEKELMFVLGLNRQRYTRRKQELFRCGIIMKVEISPRMMCLYVSTPKVKAEIIAERWKDRV